MDILKKVLSHVAVAVLVFLGTFYFVPRVNETSLGSVSRSGEYKVQRFNSGTTTSSIITGPGTLGSVILTTSTAAAFVILDWNGTTSTASTTIAKFPASLAAGTYTFDVSVYTGLFVSTTVGATGDFSITYR